MHLKSLYLHNFRLYKEAFFEFCPHINMICGQNAIGKTSLIEAIHFLASGHSFRTHQTAHLIHNGASYFHLEAHFVKRGIEQCLRITHSAKERKIYLNSTKYPSSASLMGLLLSVAFSPADIDLVKGAPQGRRQFLDSQLSQADPFYLHHSNRYARAMRQRNCLLKAKNLSSIHSWEHEMAVSAAYVLHKRVQLLEELQKTSSAFYQLIAEEVDPFSLEYRTTAKLIKDELVQQRSHYLELFKKNREKEMALACTFAGPHKDDLMLSIGERDARFFASEGQMRSCAAALRLGEWERLYLATGEKPLMLLDDVGTSLDKQRSLRMFQLFGGLGQLFITGTEEPEGYPHDKERKLILLNS
jgi:DNA replication and repair protein RecF